MILKGPLPSDLNQVQSPVRENILTKTTEASNQWDQTLENKVAQYCPKVAQQATAVIVSKGTVFKTAQKLPNIWGKIVAKTFKSSLIWSHWTQAIYLPTCLSKKKRERENESYLKCVSLPWLWSRQKVVFGSRFRVNATAAAAGVDENRSGRKQGCDVCVTLKWSRCDVGVTFMGRRCDVGVTLKWSRWN